MVSEDMDAGNVIEDSWVEEHTCDVHWIQRPKKMLNIISAFFYYRGRSADTTVFCNRSEETTVPRDSSEYTTVTGTIVASFAEASPHDRSEGSRFIDAADPDMVLNEVDIPHCLTHTPARRDCPDCIIAKRRNARNAAGVSTTVATAYGGVFLRWLMPDLRKGMAPLQLVAVNLYVVSKGELSILDMSVCRTTKH